MDTADGEGDTKVYHLESLGELPVLHTLQR